MPRRLKHPVQELEELSEKNARQFRHAMERLIRVDLFDGQTAGSSPAFLGLHSVIAETLILADLMGRRRLFLELENSGVDVTDDFRSPILPAVPFLEAIRNITRRIPKLAEGWRAVARLYREGGEAFALARSTSLTLTRKVRDTIASFAAKGTTLENAEQVISKMGDFNEAYAETVYRTNLATAYNQGRFEQARDPDVARVVGAFELVTARDVDVRRGRPEDKGENHLAADGLIASVDDPIWNRMTPPFGYNCRCGTRLVTRDELQRRKLVRPGRVEKFTPRSFSSFRAHPAFVKG